MPEQTKSMSIDTELANDLNFLVLEVKTLMDLVIASIKEIDLDKIDPIKRRDDYVDNLKDRIETLCYDRILQLNPDDKVLVANYRALIRIASSLEKVADFLVQAADQIRYIQSPALFKEINLQPFYDVIERTLDMIPNAFRRVNVNMAEKIVHAEVELDELYAQKFAMIQENISKKDISPDMLTLLFIVRYFERAGDSFQNIGEAILNISMGDALNIRHYFNLENAIKTLAKDGDNIDYDFKPFLFSRSGCKVGRLKIQYDQDGESVTQRLFYKEGSSVKIKEELDGLELWEKIAPGSVPKVLWKSLNKNHSTIIVEFLKGENLLGMILGKYDISEIQNVLNLLTDRLSDLWSHSQQKPEKKIQYIKQILSRKQAILTVHKDFFAEFEDEDGKTTSFEKILDDAKGLEKKVENPFHVLCHGDFNLDNILYKHLDDQVGFVDVHRSGYRDYAQEVSVFVVSGLRVKVTDPDIREKISLACHHLYNFAKEFAKKNGDDYFEARFAFGLFRSFITSTRFLFDDEWYQKMRSNALFVIKSLKDNKKDLKKFTFDLDRILK